MVFGVDTDADLDKGLLERAQFQIEKFEFNERSRTALNVFLASFEAAFEYAFNPGGAVGMAEFLTKTASSHVKNFGLNDWRVSVLRSLASNTAFCEGGFQKALGAIDFGKGLA